MNMWVLAKHELKHKRVGLAAYCIGGIIFLALYVGIYPSIQSQAKAFEQVLKVYPKEFLQAFNIESLNFDTLEKYLSAELFSLVWPVMAIALALGRAGSSLAGEIERGTMGLLLSLPLGRGRIFGGKVLAGWIAIVIFSALSILTTIPIALLYGVDFTAGPLFEVTMLSMLFMGAVFSLGVLASAIFSERSKVYASVSGLLLVMYVIDLIAKLKDNLDWLKYGSLFHYYDAAAVVTGHNIKLSSVEVFGGVIIVCTAIAAWRFNSRDISV
jgi:ABC-2 type transport system permease protein